MMTAVGTAPRHLQAGAAARRRVALIVEDEPQFSNMLAFHLLQAGYHPLQRFRGREAVDACARRPDLITLDILLPDLDGWSVLEQMRSAPFMQRVPVLVISVLSQAELGPDCGPTAFLHKPTPRADLVEAIERLAPGGGAARRVLHVDDDPLITDMIGAMLPPRQFEVTSASDARQAAEAIGQQLPDLILLDLVMPHVNGFEFLQTLRADPRTRPLPVLVLTAKHLTPQEQLELSQAAQLVLSKSDFTVQRMLQKLHHLERANLLYHAADDERREASPPADAPVDVAQFRDDFIREARECLAALASCAETGADRDAAARAAHTLKGSAGMMGQADLGELASRAETLLRAETSGADRLDAARRDALRDLAGQIARCLEAL